MVKQELNLGGVASGSMLLVIRITLLELLESLQLKGKYSLPVSEATITYLKKTRVIWRKKSSILLLLGIIHSLDYGEYQWAKRISRNHTSKTRSIYMVLEIL